MMAGGRFKLSSGASGLIPGFSATVTKCAFGIAFSLPQQGRFIPPPQRAKTIRKVKEESCRFFMNKEGKDKVRMS
jgi:hypothetical protein